MEPDKIMPCRNSYFCARWKLYLAILKFKNEVMKSIKMIDRLKGRAK